MKHQLTLLLLALLATGCIKNADIEIRGESFGINGAAVKAIGPKDTVVLSATVVDNIFSMEHDWKRAGFFWLTFTKKGVKEAYDVYLEPGNYKIVIDGSDMDRYPDIKSTSKTQSELTAYYSLYDGIKAALQKNVNTISTQLTDPKNQPISHTDSVTLTAKLNAAKFEEQKKGTIALAKFVAKYPGNNITLHLMGVIDHKADPQTYYNIYKGLNTNEQNSPEGKAIVASLGVNKQ